MLWQICASTIGSRDMLGHVSIEPTETVHVARASLNGPLDGLIGIP